MPTLKCVRNVVDNAGVPVTGRMMHTNPREMHMAPQVQAMMAKGDTRVRRLCIPTMAIGPNNMAQGDDFAPPCYCIADVFNFFASSST